MPKYIEIQKGLQGNAKKNTVFDRFKEDISRILSRRLDYASIGRKTQFIIEKFPEEEKIEGVIKENIIKEEE